MPVTFPSDKTQPFVAENGVTYVWANTHWRVKQYQLNAEGYVEQGEFEESQGVQDDQINALETQIQLLAKVRAVGVWKYKNQMNGDSVRPPLERGTFYGTNINEVSIPLLTWEDLRLVLMNEYDVNGTKYNFQSFNIGDRFEILSTDGKDAVFGSIAAEPNPDNNFANVLVSVERSNGGPREDQEYVISVYPPGGTEVDLEALDHRYLKLSGGTVTGQLILEREGTAGKEGLVIKGTTTNSSNDHLFRVYHNAGDTPDAINYEGRQENPTNLATVQYVKDNAGGSSKIPVVAGAPSEIEVGDMWFNTIDNGLYIKVL